METISEINEDMFIYTDNTDYVIYEESLYQNISSDNSYVVAENYSNVDFTIYIEVQEIEIM